MAAQAKVIRMDEHRAPGPQLEDGHVRIANELYDAILAKVHSLRHLKVALAIIRKTYGYSKKEDDITISQIAEVSGIHRNNVGTALRELEEMRIVNPVRAGRHGLMIGINKHHSQWLSDVVKPRGPGRKAIKLIEESTGNQTVAQGQSKRCIEAINLIETSNQLVAHNNQPQQPTPTDNSNSCAVASLPAVADAPAAPAKRATGKAHSDDADTALQLACRETWGAYCSAYATRYGVDPIRNARVSGQVKQFVKRIGHDESPQISAWFVGHPGRYYVQEMHSVGALLKDAEKLRTEWATGRIVTSTAAGQSDRRCAMASAVHSLLAECGGEA
jgi:phage replication O-like protein O